VGQALLASGLRCRSVLPLRGEGQGGLHSFAGTLKWDAVLVCRRGGAPPKKSWPAVVTRGALAKAKRQAERFARRLAADQAIGFREPDKLNLYRALIASQARSAPPRAGTMPLLAALTNPPAAGE